jgi:hypothetical protein
MALTFAELHKLNNWGIRPRQAAKIVLQKTDLPFDGNNHTLSPVISRLGPTASRHSTQYRTHFALNICNACSDNMYVRFGKTVP